MTPVELWGVKTGGAGGKVPIELVEAIQHLVARFGAEPVAQVAVLESDVLPVMPR